jgi:hypothetical protein
MQVLRKAAVLVVLGLSLEISGAYASTTRSEVSPNQSKKVTWSTVDRIGPWWNRAIGILSKAGCSINPWGLCATQVPTNDSACTIDPWGRCGVNSAIQAPTTDAGCVIDPLGRCLGR